MHDVCQSGARPVVRFSRRFLASGANGSTLGAHAEGVSQAATAGLRAALRGERIEATLRSRNLPDGKGLSPSLDRVRDEAKK